MTPADVQAGSARLCAQLAAYVDAATVIAGYLPFDNEPDLTPLLKQALAAGKTLLLPRHVGEWYDLVQLHTFESDIEMGPFGIPHPKTTTLATQTPDLWLVPGLAFDANGYRLGLGKGVYDRLLHNAPGLKVGVAYEWQRVPALPHDDWDVTLDQVAPFLCRRNTVI